MLKVFLILLIPFLGTCLGASLVFLTKNKINKFIEKLMLGFASGVMISASIFSLIIPGLEMSNNVIIVSVGFCVGVLLLLALDSLLPHLHRVINHKEGIKSNFKNNTLMFLAVTLHNIPEGMAIGVLAMGIVNHNVIMSVSSVLMLSIGMAIQNIPEGLIVSYDYIYEGSSKAKSFLYGLLSGVVEPLAGILMILFSSLLINSMPFLLSLAAGAMFYVVIEELLPASQQEKHSNIAIIGFMVGFILMMILDVSLG